MTNDSQTHLLTFMGTAAGCGVPSFFCDCPACNEARENPALSRGDCGILVRRAGITEELTPTLAIDTPPDARHQLLREGVRHVDQILFTHCHYDHIGGLGEYEYLVALKRGGEKLPVYASHEARTGLEREFAYMEYVLDYHTLQPGEQVIFDDVRYTALPLTHAPGTYGYLIDTGNTQTFYASDTGPLSPQTAGAIKGIDNLIMDATFWDKNWSPHDHHSVQECIEEGLALDVGTLYLTHLCMHYDTPITYAELQEYIAPYEGRVVVALDGMTLPI